MTQQTAVIRLEEKLKTYLSWSSFLEEDFEQAKQMEKEMIMKAARQCHFEGVRQSAKTSEEYIAYAEQYYNETYG